jgi:hypothetical protein
VFLKTCIIRARRIAKEDEGDTEHERKADVN